MVPLAVTLAASVMVGPGELDRYLTITVPSLIGFCDQVSVRVEAADELAYLIGLPKVRALAAEPAFFEHEGRARQQLLDWTLLGRPTHILAIDADEIVTDGAAIRAACESRNQGVGVWTVGIQEVWKADERNLWLRCDGGWNAQARAPLLYRAPRKGVGLWRIQDRALASGREPLAVRRVGRRALRAESDILHFGWTNVPERKARYARYVKHDGGKFHARQHLDSIMYPDSRVRLQRRAWPEDLDGRKADLLARVGR